MEIGKRSGLLGYTVDVGDGSGGSAIALAPNVFGCDDDEDDCSFSWSCSGDDCDSMTFDLGAFHRGPMLGVQIAQVTDELREHLGGARGEGILVSKVVAGSAAEDAGIEVGDLIVSVDGEAISGVGDVRKALNNKEGQTFPVEVVRDGRTQRIDVSIPERDDDRPTGPRAFRFDFDFDFSDLEGLLEHARDAMHEHGFMLHGAEQVQRHALDEARESYDAAHELHREAMEQAQKAMREFEHRRDAI